MRTTRGHILRTTKSHQGPHLADHKKSCPENNQWTHLEDSLGTHIGELPGAMLWGPPPKEMPWRGPWESEMSCHLVVFFIVIQLQLSAFSPHPSTPPQPNPPPSPTTTLPLDFVHVSFIVVPVIPSPHYPLPTPLWLLLSSSTASPM